MRLLVLILLLTSSAQAAVVIRIERNSDTTARISGSGTITSYDDSGGRVFFRLLESPAGPPPASGILHSINNNTLSVGGVLLNRSGSFDDLTVPAAIPAHTYLAMNDQPADFSEFAGSVEIQLNGQIWDPVGTSGSVIWGNSTNQVGTWSIVAPVAIPEPSCFGFLSVVAVASLVRRRRQ